MHLPGSLVELDIGDNNNSREIQDAHSCEETLSHLAMTTKPAMCQLKFRQVTQLEWQHERAQW